MEAKTIGQGDGDASIICQAIVFGFGSAVELREYKALKCG